MLVSSVARAITATGGAECNSMLQKGMDHAAQINGIAIAECYHDVSRHEVCQRQAGKRSFEAMNVGLQAHALTGIVLSSFHEDVGGWELQICYL